MIISSLILALIWPLLLCIGLLIRWKMGSPVIFRMLRPGKNCRPFVLYKLRTMNDARTPEGELLADGERLTSLGKFLRRWSLDELPQLWNVLRGDMSLVGPRPLLMEYLDLYTPEQARRHDIKPGITGWAQINGRNAITWEEKFDLDVWYVDHHGMMLDFRILFLTLWKTLSRDGISPASHATMPAFKSAEQINKRCNIHYQKD